jgi:hypothetical protein
LFQEDEMLNLVEKYHHEGQGLSRNLIYDLDLWMGDQNTLYWIGVKDDILPKIPVGDTIELLGTIQFDPSLGVPHHFRPPGGGRGGNMGRPDAGQPGQEREERFSGPNPLAGPPGMGGGPPRPRGRPPRPEPIAMSIYQWTRHKENR